MQRKSILRAITHLSTTLVSAPLLFSSAAQAIPSCQSIRDQAFPPIGTVCVERVNIKSGKADWPDERQNNIEEYTPHYCASNSIPNNAIAPLTYYPITRSGL